MIETYFELIDQKRRLYRALRHYDEYETYCDEKFEQTEKF